MNYTAAMFIRWHKRQRSRSGKNDAHWGVALTEATRINGKPRQRHIAYLGSFTEQGIDSVHQRGRFWDLVNTRLHALADRLTDEDRTRIIGEIASRVPVPTPAEHEQDDSDRANQELDDLIRSGLFAPSAEDDYLVRAVELFRETKEHLGVDKAFVIFKSAASPSPSQLKLFKEKMLWRAYKSLPGYEKLTWDKAAQQIYEKFRIGGRKFGNSPDAIRKSLLREQKRRDEQRDQAVSYLYEGLKKAGRPASLDAIRKSLLRIEQKTELISRDRAGQPLSLDPAR